MDSSNSGESSTIVKVSQQLKITNYSLLKGIGSGKYISSEPFSVDGNDWAIYFYPDGKNEDCNAAYVSVFIVLISDTGKDVKALFELVLLDQTGNDNDMVHSQFQGTLLREAYTMRYPGSMWGYKKFIKKIDLESSNFLKDDCIYINCTIGVVKTHMEEHASFTLNCPHSSNILP